MPGTRGYCRFNIFKFFISGNRLSFQCPSENGTGGAVPRAVSAARRQLAVLRQLRTSTVYVWLLQHVLYVYSLKLIVTVVTRQRNKHI